MCAPPQKKPVPASSRPHPPEHLSGGKANDEHEVFPPVRFDYEKPEHMGPWQPDTVQGLVPGPLIDHDALQRRRVGSGVWILL